MDSRRETDRRALSIDPTTRGFGYAVLEGPAFLVDWGTRDLGRADSRRALEHVELLLDHWRPDVVVVEDTSHASARRRDRARELIAAIGEVAAKRGLEVARIARVHVRRLFETADSANKHQIAQTIADHFPELAPRLPPVRKAWMSEDTRMSIFDAVAFTLAFYFHAERPPTPDQPPQERSHEPSQHPDGARP
jgi:Holliday junction resolvasome RuvABC endonuclease subunit